MNNFSEEKKPKRFNARTKKYIAFGILSTATLTGVTFAAIRLSHQEKPGKVIPINFQWEGQRLESEEAKDKVKEHFVDAFCVALLKYKADLQALVKNPNTNWAQRKETTFSLDNGKNFVGGNNYTSKISSAKEAQEAITQMQAYLTLKDKFGPKAYKEKLRFEFTNKFLKEILQNVRNTLVEHGIPWQK
ncbi:MAG: hypothetical protein HRT98_03110 [Mycoplasmatales bacterium]|nr:hypothetical protein [Mycoplasmatales bacterium]